MSSESIPKEYYRHEWHLPYSYVSCKKCVRTATSGQPATMRTEPRLHIVNQTC